MIRLTGTTLPHALLLCSVLLSSITQAAEINADSSIKAVTIYPRSAKVTRISKISLTAGENDIIINNLPINLNESSLRVSGEGVGKITLGSVELIRNIQKDVVQERERVLRDKIEALQDDRAEINDAVTRHRSQLQYIQKMVLGDNSRVLDHPETAQKGGYENLPLEQWQQAWQTLDSATQSVQDKIRTAQKSLRTLDRKVNKLKRELRRVAVNHTETRSARLHVESDMATELSLSLSYQIHGARWTPVYDADLDTTSGNIRLKSLAQISQRTGEDWTDVAVTLSTLRPSASSQLPNLNPWVIDFMPEVMPYARTLGMQKRMRSTNSMDKESDMVAGMAMEAIVEAMPMAAAPAPVVAQAMVEDTGEIVSADFSAEYKVSGKISLTSGSNKRRFSLMTKNLKSEIYLASVPRVDPRAMIVSTIKYEAETPLLAGSLSLYRNGNFVGNTYLSQKLSGEKIKLSFGEDDKVKISFQPDPDKKRKDGILFGKRKVVERHYQVSINNNHDKAYVIKLYDTIPVASNENIKVKKTGDAPTKTNVDDKKGVVAWVRSLKPKSETKLKYGYTVSYPEDKIIPGL